ncbi:hypothetical protein H6F90_12485 [Trichocoleus sp. FACHB-591]|uniref:hypothetical protein n=1 Tax=Trichocoleus sp. FACHB-591 TaxID=2692872 RepID=UPI001688DE47|nr:hypothetical protein [Trichocoleus sp. FACHB-591]MBD2095964.1 hypothetical protein [Trichocoleus sp. FACHB-591]
MSIAASATSAPPPDFNACFNWAKAQGMVLAATPIDGIHPTLYVQQGWVATE